MVLPQNKEILEAKIILKKVIYSTQCCIKVYNRLLQPLLDYNSEGRSKIMKPGLKIQYNGKMLHKFKSLIQSQALNLVP